MSSVVKISDDLADYGLRPVKSLEGVGPYDDPGPCGDIVWVSPKDLVISEDYQRQLSNQSRRLIMRMAKSWDWKKFKVLSLVFSEIPGKYEVIDGQHSAIAAATNGRIPLLPGLLNDAHDLKDKAAGFLGINQERISLTPVNIFLAKVTAQEHSATEIYGIISEAECELLEQARPGHKYQFGDLMAIGSIQIVYNRRGGDILSRILKICKTAECAPITATFIKAMALILPPVSTHDYDLIQFIRNQGAGRLELIARSETNKGYQLSITLANKLRDTVGIPWPEKGRRGSARRFY